MAKWTVFPHLGDYQFDAASATKHWARLHAGDAEPMPKDPACSRPGCCCTTASSSRPGRPD